MYTDFTHDINRPIDVFDDWALSLDAWLDTPAGAAWLDDQADAFEMARSAETYSARPGFEDRTHASH